MRRRLVQILIDLSCVLAVIVVVFISIGRAAVAGQSTVDEGHRLVIAHRSSCHAVGAKGESPRAAAPPFRRLNERYSADALNEAFREGLIKSHPSMPAFRFSNDETTAILNYLRSIQESQGV